MSFPAPLEYGPGLFSRLRSSLVIVAVSLVRSAPEWSGCWLTKTRTHRRATSGMSRAARYSVAHLLHHAARSHVARPRLVARVTNVRSRPNLRRGLQGDDTVLAATT